MYKYLRRILEYITGYPADPNLAAEYRWAWRETGVRPRRVMSEDSVDFPTFVFQKGPVSYFCCSDYDGNYVIGNTDTDGIFKEKAYRRRSILISKHLGKRPQDCSKEEAVRFCARAVCIDREHEGESVNTSSLDLVGSEHSIMSF